MQIKVLYINLFALGTVDEYREHEQHKSNLIFHKVPKSTHLDSSSRREKDVKFILTVANELGVNQLMLSVWASLVRLRHTCLKWQ